MSTRPNILFLFPDQLRGDWVGFRHFEPVRTPNIDRLAETGLAFTHAWTPSPLCAPARACFATAREFARSPVRTNGEDLPTTTPTIYQHMRDAGYRVATLGKLDLLKKAMDWGLDGRHGPPGASRLAELGFTDGMDNAGKHDAIRAYERGAEEPYFTFLRSKGLDRLHADDFSRREHEVTQTIAEAMATSPPASDTYANVEPTPLPDEAYCDNWIGRNAVALIDDLEATGAPWFMQVNFAGPHVPMDVTPAMRDRWQDVAFSPPYGRSDADAALQQAIRQRYAAMIEVIDHWVGEMVARLAAVGALDNTLIVFASDHGEMLGDYNLWGKRLPFEASVTVPLIFAGAGVKGSGRISPAPVSLIDVAATALELAGAGPEGDGRSLVPILEERAASIRPYAFSGIGRWRAVTDGRFKLVAGFDVDVPSTKLQAGQFDAEAARQNLALYDLETDRWEAHDLAADRPALVQQLWSALIANEGRAGTDG